MIINFIVDEIDIIQYCILVQENRFYVLGFKVAMKCKQGM